MRSHSRLRLAGAGRDLALWFVLLNVGAPRVPVAPDYGCPLPGTARIAQADGLAAGGWTSSGTFIDPRPIGIDAQRNRILVKHGGLDLIGTPGDQVSAVRDGRVAVATTWTHLGKTVVLDHGDGFYSVYGYLGSIDVIEGAFVQHGASVGAVGFSGDAATIQQQHPDATPRLHFALVSAPRSGLAAAGQPLRRIGDGLDAWTSSLDSIATAIDPAKLLPSKCLDSH